MPELFADNNAEKLRKLKNKPNETILDIDGIALANHQSQPTSSPRAVTTDVIPVAETHVGERRTGRRIQR